MLEFAVLGLLDEAPMHGYELRTRLKAVLGAFRAFSYGSLYPTLRRMRERGWIVEGNRFRDCAFGLYAVRANRFLVAENDFSTGPRSYNVQLTGGASNRIERNSFDGGITAVGFTFQFSTAGPQGAT